MDNLTHSLVGLALGQLIQRSLRPEDDASTQRLRGRLLLVAGAAASNFPDLDLVLTPLLPAPLGYLLHHRGHTHTLLYALPQALLLFGLLMLLWPAARKLLRASNSARFGLVMSILLGLSLHLLMDALNSYGIHPFHPFDSRWFYGDRVFIAEPAFWVLFGVPLALQIGRAWLRIGLVSLLIALCLGLTLLQYLTWSSLILLALAALALFVLHQRGAAQGRGSLLAAFALSVVFVGVQGFASAKARAVLARAWQAEDPRLRVLDSALSPFPSNPVCWMYVSILSDPRRDLYLVRRGILSLAPAQVPVSACPSAFFAHERLTVLSPALALQWQQQGSLKALRDLKQQNCHFAAWLRFARAPFLSGAEATDVRFGSLAEHNFATLKLADFVDQKCSPYVPQWDFPRADLLTDSAR